MICVRSTPGWSRPACQRARCKRAVSMWLIATWLCFFAGPALAQPITVTAGEHIGFTRIVLSSARGFDWDLTETDSGVALRLDGNAGRRVRLDIARSLDRIPRVRVAQLRVDDSTVMLDLGCPCPTRVFEDRPGVLVIDVLDPDSTPADPATAIVATGRSVPRTHTAESMAISAGRSLALNLAEASDGQRVPPPPPADPSREQVVAAVSGLSALLAIAMTQGLVEPTEPLPPQPGLLGPAAGVTALPELPQNLRTRNASDAMLSETAAPSRSICPSPEVVAFATSVQRPNFLDPFSALNARLFEEFDVPAPEPLKELIEHYLAWGFGAEARVLIESSTVVIEGRDLLIALADMIEGRHSNARQSLAGLVDCPEPIALFAVLAGANTERGAQTPEQLAASYQLLTPGLRMVLGPELISRLLSADAIEAARIALDAFRRVVSAEDSELVRLTAGLDQARDDPGLAVRRLASAQSHPIASVQMRLEIALSQEMLLSPDMVADAVALASAHRGEGTGRRVMELAILHQTRAGRLREALVDLERFSSWLDPTPGAATRINELRNIIWQEALRLSDPEFLDLVLTRNDWRSHVLNPAVLSGLADKFDDLGLAGLAVETRARAGTPDIGPLPHVHSSSAFVRSDGSEGFDAERESDATRPSSPIVGAQAQNPQSGPFASPMAGEPAPLPNPQTSPVDGSPFSSSSMSEDGGGAGVGTASASASPTAPASLFVPDVSEQRVTTPNGAMPPAVTDAAHAGLGLDPMSRSITALAATERLRAALIDLDLPLR
jgi:hypothetical protein